MSENWWNVAENALKKGDWRIALSQLGKVDPGFQEEPDHLKLLCCSYIQAGRWNNVSMISASASQRFPDEVVFLECWAWSEYMLGGTSAAVGILESASSRFPERENSIYMLACLYAALNRLSEAKYCLARAKELSSDPELFVLKASKQKEFANLWAGSQVAFAC